jgi:hypothetical protein
MRWDKPKPARPVNGEKRQSKQFAWKPTEVERFIVWLEFYGVEESYFKSVSGPGWWSVDRYYTLDSYC